MLPLIVLADMLIDPAPPICAHCIYSFISYYLGILVYKFVYSLCSHNSYTFLKEHRIYSLTLYWQCIDVCMCSLKM